MLQILVTFYLMLFPWICARTLNFFDCVKHPSRGGDDEDDDNMPLYEKILREISGIFVTRNTEEQPVTHRIFRDITCYDDLEDGTLWGRMLPY